MPHCEKQYSNPVRKGKVAAGPSWAAERNGGAVSFLAMSKVQRAVLRSFLMVVLGCVLLAPAKAQFAQQGLRLIGSGATVPSEQGRAVSVSLDGNTMIVGGPFDTVNTVPNAGAAWIFTRSGGSWSQVGSKLTPAFVVVPPSSEETGDGHFGYSVAISADGKTAIVGAPDDNGGIGAAWIFVKSGGGWSEQQGPLIGSHAANLAGRGASVAISADGNTALVGGPSESANTGAVWVWRRSGSSWAQQGANALVGTPAVGSSMQGISVGLSSDGNTAIVGGPGYSTNTGAAWIFTFDGTAWTQAAGPLAGTGVTGSAAAQQGSSVALSLDGNTAIVGGRFDANNLGAAWIFTLIDSVWTQQGAKLADTGYVSSNQGTAVSLSADGNMALIGGLADSGNAVGAAWIYLRTWVQPVITPTSTTPGFWQWRLSNKLVASDSTGAPRQGVAVSLSGDGTTAAVGGFTNRETGDNTGATWVYAVPDLTIEISHGGTFARGGSGGHFTIAVKNSAGGPTSGAVTVTVTIPTGLSTPSMSGTGWGSCSATATTATCSRSDALAQGASYDDLTLNVTVTAGAPTPLIVSGVVSGGSELNLLNDSASDVVKLPVVPDLVLSVSHGGSLYRGRTGVPYTILVSNISAGTTSGTVSVSDSLPSGLINLGNLTGMGWSCASGGTAFPCTRSNALQGSSAYQAITFTADVDSGFSGSTLTVSASVSGGGEVNTSTDSASAAANVSVSGPGLNISMSHIGTFKHGSTGAYAIIVSNTSSSPTSGTVTVTVSLPGSLTAAAIDGGRGWTCKLSPLKCTRIDPLLPGLSYHLIALTVNVVGGSGTVSPAPSASVSGGSATGSTATDPTVIQ